MNNKKLGNKIAKVRKEENMSQAQLAELYSLAPKRLENGSGESLCQTF
jgi:transcriptional regulator with XRE-family HTH domain